MRALLQSNRGLLPELGDIYDDDDDGSMGERSQE